MGDRIAAGPGGKAGYTLIELTVVLVVIGIMLVISAPRFRQSLLTNSLNSASRRIIVLAHDARDRAIHQQQDILCHFDITNSRIWCEAPTSSPEEQETPQRAYRLPDDVRILDVWSMGHGKQTTGKALILFHPKGYVEPAMIHLATRDGRQVSLELAPFLGTVKLHDSYVEASSQ